MWSLEDWVESCPDEKVEYGLVMDNLIAFDKFLKNKEVKTLDDATTILPEAHRDTTIFPPGESRNINFTMWPIDTTGGIELIHIGFIFGKDRELKNLENLVTILVTKGGHLSKQDPYHCFMMVLSMIPYHENPELFKKLFSICPKPMNKWEMEGIDTLLEELAENGEYDLISFTLDHFDDEVDDEMCKELLHDAYKSNNEIIVKIVLKHTTTPLDTLCSGIFDPDTTDATAFVEFVTAIAPRKRQKVENVITEAAAEKGAQT